MPCERAAESDSESEPAESEAERESAESEAEREPAESESEVCVERSGRGQPRASQRVSPS